MEEITFSLQFAKMIGVFGVGLPQVFLALFMCFLAAKVRNWFTPHDDNTQLFVKNNVAYGIATAGYYLGLLIAFGGVLSGVSRGLLPDMGDVLAYGALAIILLNVSRIVMDNFVLVNFKIDNELVRDQNAGTGWAMFGGYFASGMVIAGAIAGDDTQPLLNGIGSTIVYWFIGQVIIIFAARIYETITSYSVHEQIEKDNVAAGQALGGYIAAAGVIVGNAGFDKMGVDVGSIVLYLLWSLAGLIILGIFGRWLLADKILSPGYKLNDEIGEQGNRATGSILFVAFQFIAWIFVWAV